MPRWAIWAIIAAIIGIGVGAQMFSTTAGEKLSYTEFLQQVRNGSVQKVTINNATNTITGTLSDGSKFSTTGAVTLSDADEQLLKQMGVDYDYKTPQANWFTSLVPIVLPFLFVIAFFMWMQRRAMGQQGNIMSIGRSKAKAYQADKPSTTFADVAGYDGVKMEIKEVVDFLRMPERFKEIGARVPKGILLVGPPGTGKTLFARAVAGEAGVGFLSVTGSDFMEMFVGVGASRVRDLFMQARKMGRAIIFVDEIDSIGRKRGAGLGGGHDEREQTLNQMLAEMDGFETTEGIVVLAATNRPDILDPALLRPGRFDRQIVVPLPESDERLAILRVHSRDKRIGPDVDLDTMAKATPGMSGADLANLVNEAALFAVRRGSTHIERIDFENARDRVVLGASRESLVLTVEEKKATAYHEGGHAILATVLPNSDPLHKVTILPRGMALGVTWTLPEERHTYSREYFLDVICKAMGGRVAEKIVFNQLNSGAANDLEQATNIARRMVREWGMSDTVGPMAWHGQQQVFLGEDLMTSGREYSDATAKTMDDEIARILLEQEQRAHDLLMKHRKGLDLVAQALLDQETIDGPTVGRLIQQGLDTPAASETPIS
ncbi:MAG: ATP-dependent metallopeptidase FtsH/Yme1/Tma family protein [Actinobacteria bacterium]|nr:ATP-dependent metallopeptidase FtsH/Yme1/Tma family protein [Actinomycetota bacterium]